ncbi:MAG: DeoR/GlpR family DNA-binding transcription regulator [Planctomycetes bacterium]|nr:DeoR/GlpR family DNA-binding transcription regulator [Planctomycetota bacterium]
MYAEERRQHIWRLLDRQKRVDVAQLAVSLDISPETVRRDLNEMQAEGVLKRTHGGAIATGGQQSRPLLSLLSRKQVHFGEKVRLARQAAARVAPGDVIAIDNSSTALCLLECLPRDCRLTIVTNALHVAAGIMALAESEWTCVCLGGVVMPANSSTYGSMAADNLRLFQPKKLFLSCAGIDPAGMLTEGNLEEAEIKRELLRCSQKSFLLVDGSKWRQVGAVNVDRIDAVDCVFTTGTVSAERLAGLRDQGIEVVVA